MSKFDQAKSFLRARLTAQGEPALSVKAAGLASGLSGRTLDRAGAHLGVTKAKIGRAWYWRLPGKNAKQPKGYQANTEDCQTPELDLTEPGIDQAADDSETSKLGPGRRKVAWGRKKKGWAGGAFRAVKCGDCVHMYDIEDHGTHGYCSVGDVSMTFIYAYRRCDMYEELTPRLRTRCLTGNE